MNVNKSKMKIKVKKVFTAKMLWIEDPPGTPLVQDLF